MSPDRDNRVPEDDYEEYAEDEPRSVFSTTWFRAIVVVVVLAVVGIVALPYLLDWVSPLRSGPTVTGPTLTSPSPPRETAAAPPSPAPVSPPAAGGSPNPPASSSAGEPAKTPSPTASSPGATPSAPAPKTAEPSKTDAGKSPTPASQAHRAAAESKPVESSAKTGKAMEAASRETAARAGGVFWVQVGAFRDEARAKALSAKLRAASFKVEEVGPSTAGGGTPGPVGTEGPTPVSPTDRYDVFVSGASSSDVNTKLAGKGLAADPVAGGAVVKPSLPLRDAVALSKDLATEGLKVQVRRAAGAAAAERPATSGDAGGGLYRVRIGSFPDRAAAEEARRTLAAKGYNGFIARSGG